MNVLITGVTGQDGYYLVQELQASHPQCRIYGLYRGQEEQRLSRFRTELPGVYWLRGDMTDASSLIAAVQESEPDWVFNLAAASFVGLSWQMAQLYMEVNAGGTLNLLEAVRKLAPKAHFIQASTSEMFGNSNGRQKLSEHSPMQPASPYGTSKLAAHHYCRNYREAYGMHVSCAIAFNHESPRRPPVFVTRKVTQAVARIAAGDQAVLQIGNTGAFRDWGYAADYMKAYIRMAEADWPEDFVIGTGRVHTVEDLLEVAFACADLDWREWVTVNSPADMRLRDVDYLCADPSWIKHRLDWRAETSFEGLIAMMVQHDMKESHALLRAG